MSNEQLNELRRQIHDECDSADRGIVSANQRCGGVLFAWVAFVHASTQAVRAAADQLFGSLGDSAQLRDRARSLRQVQDDVSGLASLVVPDRLPSKETWREADESYRASSARQYDALGDLSTVTLNTAIALEWTAKMVDGYTEAVGEFLLATLDLMREIVMTLAEIENPLRAAIGLTHIAMIFKEVMDSAADEDFWSYGITDSLSSYTHEQTRLREGFPDGGWPQATAS